LTVNVYLFGSRASGRPRATRDVDVAIDATAPLPPGVLATLREALEESTIPYRVDWWTWRRRFGLPGAHPS
jgi:predicted nucleotidyltransferase